MGDQMPYSAAIERGNPSCFLFVVDRSGSMQENFGGEQPKPKSSGVSDAINKLLANLTIKCSKGDVRDYYHVGVLGYGDSVGPAFSGVLAARDLVPISEIGNNPARIETRTKKVPDGAGGLVDQDVRFPIWFDPVSSGGTPMCAALNEAHRIVGGWIQGHPNCFPPVVIHITDGESSDGDASGAMEKLKNLETTDGKVVLFNVHLSGNDATSVLFPDSASGLKDKYSQMLFDGASVLTPFMRTVAKEHGINAGEGSRSFVFNAELVMLIQALDIGTRPSNLR
jgi:hypothetical protein